MWLEDEYGISRKHKEVPRLPFDGEKIKIISTLYEQEGIKANDILPAIRSGAEVFVQVSAGETIFLDSTEFVVLEETDIIRIDKQDYQELSREVAEGDTILLLRGNERKGYIKGQLLTVVSTQGDMLLGYSTESEQAYNVWKGEYIIIQELKRTGSVDKRILSRFDSEQKAILASTLPLKDCFDLILQIEKIRKDQQQ